jgi:Tfp pilus assembly protein PilZ
MTEDKRKAKRAPSNIRIYFGKKSADRLGFVQDLSERGLRIRARKLYPEKTELLLHIEVPGHGMMNATGMVKRARMIEPAIDPYHPAEMGIVILDGNKRLEEMIKKLLEEYSDQRAIQRKEVQLKISVGEIQRLIFEYTQNIGVGGIFVVTENPPPHGSIIEAALQLPEIEDEIHTQCAVTHVCPPESASELGRLPGAGLRFISFAKGHEEKYLKYLDALPR